MSLIVANVALVIVDSDPYFDTKAGTPFNAFCAPLRAPSQRRSQRQSPPSGGPASRQLGVLGGSPSVGAWPCAAVDAHPLPPHALPPCPLPDSRTPALPAARHVL